MRYLRYFKINESIVNKVDIDYYFDIQYKFGVRLIASSNMFK